MTKLTDQNKKVAIDIEENKLYTPLDAISLMQKNAQAKFIETAEAHINLNLNPKYADQQLRSSTILPRGLGKNIKIAVIAKGEKVSEALSVGAEVAGSDDLVTAISNGQIDFDKLIATPDTMPIIAKLGRILGPRGLMPSPKTGTVTYNIKSAVEDFKKGKIEYKIDKTGVVHIPFGKVNFLNTDLLINLQNIIISINKNRPSGVKGKLWKKVHICSTMGRSIDVDYMQLLA